MRSSLRYEADGADLRNLLTQMSLDSHREIFCGQVAIRTVTGAANDRASGVRVEFHELDIHRVDPEHGAHLVDGRTNAIIDIRCGALPEE